jgi:hypothetical protein
MPQALRSIPGREESAEASLLSGIRLGVGGCAAVTAVVVMGAVSFLWPEAFRADSIAATVLVGGVGLSCMAALSGAVLKRAPFALWAVSLPAGILATVGQIDGVAALASGLRASWMGVFCPLLVAAGVLGLTGAWLVRTYRAGGEEAGERAERRVVPFEVDRLPRRRRERVRRPWYPGDRGSPGLEVVPPGEGD